MAKYVCEDCGSKFTEPNETKVGNLWKKCCPICNSMNIGKDKDYKQQADDLKTFIADCNYIKQLLTNVQVSAGRKAEGYKIISFNDLIADMQEIRNNINECIEKLEEYK
ncbi:MAG: hypothetical protein KBT03_02875 [Bacteroidales bacterium]|nr:hypothetical protein [Candidatus Scybalousia scybalohippi]